MEWAGWIALMILLFYSSYPKRVKRLERKVKKWRKQQGGSTMSKIIHDLIGKRCKIQTEEGLLAGNGDFVCTVLEVDDEWIKYTYTEKKGNIKTKILRIDAIEKVELIAE